MAQRLLQSGSASFPDDPGGIFSQAPNGRYYASHEIGNTVAMLPAVFLGNLLQELAGRQVHLDRRDRLSLTLIVLISAASVALTAALVYWILSASFRIPQSHAKLTACLLCTTTFLLPYSRNLFDGVLAMLLITVTVAAAFKFALGRQYMVWPAIAGTTVGAALATRITSVLVIPLVAAYIGSMAYRRRDLRFAILACAAFLFSALPFVAWQAAYNLLRTGTPWLSPVQLPQYAANNGLDGNLLVGLTGLILSPGKSIIVYCPVLLLAPLGAREMWRRFPYEVLLLCVAVLGQVLVYSKIRNWPGDWGWGPRYSVLYIPLLFIFVGFAWEKIAVRPWGIIAATALSLWGFVVNASATVGNWHFRMSLAASQGRLGARWVWSIDGSQWVDSLRGVADNLKHILGAPPPDLPSYSALNIASSTTVNFWWITIGRLGVPLVLTASMALLMLAGGVWLILSTDYSESRSTSVTSSSD